MMSKFPLRSSTAMLLCLSMLPAAAAETESVEEITVMDRAIHVAPSAPPTDVTQPTSAVEREFIQNNIIPLASFDDIVKFAPSVWDQSPNGPGLGKSETLSIRGFQDSQFNVTFDGIPFGDATDLHHTSSALFIAHDIGEARVDRGPGSASTIGNATFGGTLGFTTKNPLDVFTANVYSTYGSWNTKAIGAEVDSGDTPLGKMFVDVQRETSDGYLTHAAEIRSNFMVKDVLKLNEDVKITAQASYNHAFEYTTQGTTEANIAQYGPNFGLGSDPKTQAFYGYQPSNYYSDFDYVDIDANFAGNWHLKNTLYTDAFTHNYIESSDASQTSAAYDGVTYYSATGTKLKPQPAGAATDIPGKNTNATFRAYGDITRVTGDFSFGQVQAGLWVDRNDDKRWSQSTDLTKGDLPVDGKYGTPYSYDISDSLTTVMPYVEMDWQAAPDLLVTPGVRYADFTRDMNALLNKTKPPAPADLSQSWTIALPSVAARYTIAEDWTAYAQAAEGFLAPPINLLEVSGSLNSVKPEVTWNYQIGTSARRNDWVVGLDAYYIDFSNYITSTTSGAITTYLNGGGAVYKGAEAELQYVLGHGFSVYGNASWNDANYKGSDVRLALTPEWTAAAGVLYDDPDGLYFSVIGKWIGGRYGNDVAADGVSHGNSIWLQPYVTADLAGGYRFKSLIPALSDVTLSVKVSNLFDNTKINGYAGTQSGTNADLFWTTAGRSAFVNLSVSY
jgi:iron complex outermembrane receptor protein